MKPLQEQLAPLLERLKAMSLQQRIVLIALVAAVAGGGLWAWAQATAPRYALLFSNLESSDAAQIVERLKQNKTLYKIEGGGSEILVPEESVHELRLTLAGEGLPNGGGVGFELFDEQRFGESEFSEQVKYHRALEGELSRTITHLSGVESARVHLVLPTRSLFASADNAASASVALRLKPGARVSRDQTRGIVHLVASSVRGLTPEMVTIVDGSGRRLAGGDDESETVTNSLEFQRNYERGLSRDLQQILDTAVGPGKAVVRVAADVTFAREETTEERVDPEQVAARSFQIVEERDVNAGVTSGGVPGAVSTLEGSDPNLAAKTGQGIVRRSETRNFEVSKTVRKAIEPVGRITRLSLAVAVDGYWTGKGDKRAFKARSAQELATIKSLVASAAGLKEARGDQIAVECVPFAAPETVEKDAAEPKSIATLVRSNWQIAAGAGGALLLALIVVTVLLLRRKKQDRQELASKGIRVELSKVEPPLSVEAKDVVAAALESRALPGGSDKPREKTAESEVEDDNTQQEAERLRALTANIAANDPYLASRVIRAWLRESSEQASAAAPKSEEAA
jgi:flagellar M-ring protein FliF